VRGNGEALCGRNAIVVTVQNHRNLLVWQKAYALSVRVYRVARHVARLDRSGLASQMQRAAHSIRANIAEGCSRASNKDFAKFIKIAIASASELEDHLEFAADLELIPPNDGAFLCGQVVEVRRMLYGLLRKLNGGEE
jgi:four helix bundle protein